jgi:hypothetical protein
MEETLEGGCLCGAVRYVISQPPMMVGNCYCVDCRKSSATTHGTHVVLPEDAFAVAGTLRDYEKAADSGNIVTRAFCPACGSAIVSRNSGMPGMVFVRASSLDNLDRVEPQMTVYASRAPAWAPIDKSKPVFGTMPEGGPAAVLADL